MWADDAELVAKSATVAPVGWVTGSESASRSSRRPYLDFVIRILPGPADRVLVTDAAEALVLLGRQQALLAGVVHDHFAVRGGRPGALVGLRASLDQLEATLRQWDLLHRRLAQAVAAPVPTGQEQG
jgi:hypothetical protein